MIPDQVNSFCYSKTKVILLFFQDYYRSMMTKRLDVPIPPSPISIPQSSSSPIPTTSSSPFHQQRLSSSTLSPTSSMAQLTTNSPPIVSHQQDPLKNKLSEILNEQRVLQQRKEELERMVREIFSSDLFTTNSYKQIEQLIIGY
jgi:flagellar capping protein FliD